MPQNVSWSPASAGISAAGSTPASPTTNRSTGSSGGTRCAGPRAGRAARPTESSRATSATRDRRSSPPPGWDRSWHMTSRQAARAGRPGGMKEMNVIAQCSCSPAVQKADSVRRRGSSRAGRYGNSPRPGAVHEEMEPKGVCREAATPRMLVEVEVTCALRPARRTALTVLRFTNLIGQGRLASWSDTSRCRGATGSVRMCGLHLLHADGRAGGAPAGAVEGNAREQVNVGGSGVACLLSPAIRRAGRMRRPVRGRRYPRGPADKTHRHVD